MPSPCYEDFKANQYPKLKKKKKKKTTKTKQKKQKISRIPFAFSTLIDFDNILYKMKYLVSSRMISQIFLKCILYKMINMITILI